VDVAAKAGSFGTLLAAAQAAGLAETLAGKGPFTVFAPTDEAFAKLPAGTVENLLKPENKATLAAILSYHVVPGRVMAKDVKTMPAGTANGQRVDIVVKDGAVTVDGAKVVKTDVTADNGVIHVIDRVIMPSDQTIVQTAVKAGSFKTLAMLLDKAGLVETLSGPGPFTVFAPTDDAFAKLPKETVESLLKPENKAALVRVLTYHVVPGRVFSNKVASKGWSASTVQGGELTSAASGKGWTVSGSGISATDIDASNGVIHVIDTVLMPK
jgi:transforming growth factor-beta-induced protein